jgi:hypothetical protein
MNLKAETTGSSGTVVPTRRARRVIELGLVEGRRGSVDAQTRTHGLANVGRSWKA